MVSIVTSVQDSVPDFDMNILQIWMLYHYIFNKNNYKLINKCINSGLYAKMCKQCLQEDSLTQKLMSAKMQASVSLHVSSTIKYLK